MPVNKKALSYSIFFLGAFFLGTASALFYTTPSSGTLRRLGSVVSEYYVSPTGSDSNPGTKDLPFATIAKARDTIRAGSLKGVTVYIREGTYHLSAPIALTSADAGDTDAPNVYANYPGETPLILGSVDLPLSVGATGTVSLDLAAAGLSAQTLKGVFFNASMQTLARTPNANTPNFEASDPWAGSFFYADSTTPQTKYQVAYSPTDFNPADWASLSGARMLVYSNANYWSDLVNIQADDPIAHTLTLGANAYDLIKPGNRYYIENRPEFLDVPGEWYQNEGSNTLSFMLPHVALVTDRLSVTPNIKAFTLTGTHDITLRGLDIREFGDIAVTVDSSTRINLEGLSLRNIRNKSVLIQNESTGVTLKNSYIRDVVDGVELGYSLPHMKALTSMNIEIINNDISNLDLTAAGQRQPILVRGVGVHVANNELHDVPRMGIAVYGAAENTIEYNRIYNTARSTEDAGAIYIESITSDGPSDSRQRTWIARGNTIRGNYISNTGGYGKDSSTGNWMLPYLSYGIYPDDYTSSTLIEKNVVTGIGSSCFLNHSGRENIWQNNICYTTTGTIGLAQFAEDASQPGVDPNAMWTHVQGMSAAGYDFAKWIAAYPDLANVPQSQTQGSGTIMTNNIFQKNILVSAATSLTTVGVFRSLAPSNTFDYNLYYTGPSRNITFGGTLIGHSCVSGCGFSTWQSYGYDPHGTTGDPLFVNAAAGDFSLNSSSPALALGFVPVDTNLAGSRMNGCLAISSGTGSNLAGVQVEVRPAGSSTILSSASGLTSSDGLLQLGSSKALLLDSSSVYDVWVKPQGYLAHKLSSVKTLSGSCLPVERFIPGDFNNDNGVSLTDVVVAIRAYNGSSDTQAQQANLVFGGSTSLGNIVTVVRSLNETPQGD